MGLVQIAGSGQSCCWSGVIVRLTKGWAGRRALVPSECSRLSACVTGPAVRLVQALPPLGSGCCSFSIYPFGFWSSVNIGVLSSRGVLILGSLPWAALPVLAKL
eukprot:scaffold170724_cov26-Tisochrysis_lutea.AAC.1